MYKTGFYTALGQYCYKRIGQGLTGAPSTYSRLKDLATGTIPAPNSEPSLSHHPRVAFEFFLDDDQGAAESIEEMLDFLHNSYFPRLAWAGLTLNPKKTRFMTGSMQILGHQCT